MTKLSSLQQPWNAECTQCKDPMAFNGFYSCQCTNINCKNYSETQKKKSEEYIEYLEKLKKETYEENSKFYSFTYNSYNTSDEEDNLEEDLQIRSYRSYTIHDPPINTDSDDDILLNLDQKCTNTELDTKNNCTKS
jgi:hypothetical protein